MNEYERILLRIKVMEKSGFQKWLKDTGHTDRRIMITKRFTTDGLFKRLKKSAVEKK